MRRNRILANCRAAWGVGGVYTIECKKDEDSGGWIARVEMGLDHCVERRLLMRLRMGLGRVGMI